MWPLLIVVLTLLLPSVWAQPVVENDTIRLEFFGGQANQKVLRDFYKEYERIPTPVQKRFAAHKVTVVLTTKGNTVSDWLKANLGVSEPDTAQWRSDLLKAIIPETWPMHDAAGIKGIGSVVTHELGHAFDTVAGNPSQSDDFRGIIDDLATAGRWEWADYGDPDAFDLNCPACRKSKPDKRSYVEIFARAFDDYTDLSNTDRLPFPPQLESYFNQLIYKPSSRPNSISTTAGPDSTQPLEPPAGNGKKPVRVIKVLRPKKPGQ